jgi:hypothetical protein
MECLPDCMCLWSLGVTRTRYWFGALLFLRGALLLWCNSHIVVCMELCLLVCIPCLLLELPLLKQPVMQQTNVCEVAAFWVGTS